MTNKYTGPDRRRMSRDTALAFVICILLSAFIGYGAGKYFGALEATAIQVANQ